MPTFSAPAAPAPAAGPNDAAMVAKYEAVQPGAVKPQAGAVEKPAAAPVKEDAPILGKFKSQADLEAAYVALERKQSGAAEQPVEKKPDAPVEEKKPDAPVEGEPPTADVVEKTLTAQGIDFGALKTEYAGKGELSAESYAALAAKGYDKELVDSHIAGMKAQSELAQFRTEQLNSSVRADVGGDEKYAEMIKWAGTGLPAAEIEAFNAAVTSGDAERAKLAARGVMAKFVSANGSEPSLIDGDDSPAQSDVFKSSAEVTKAMRDPRYKKDAAYREEVIAKLGRSDL